jgi:hypothetical protein
VKGGLKESSISLALFTARLQITAISAGRTLHGRTKRDKYDAKMFLKTNVLDSTFFMDHRKTANLIKKYRRNN